MSPKPVLQPATSAERYPHIDILRGLALFGVLMVNLETLFRVPLLEHILRPHTPAGLANRIADLLVSSALEFKAFTIFSFLFGIGIAIQTERSAARHVSARRFLARRLAWLFLLGAAHLFLVWNGDILALYAICGMLLLPSLGLRWPALFAIGAAVMALPEVLPLGPSLPSGTAANDLIAQSREVYGNGSFLSILRFRWHESWLLVVPLLMAALPRTAGLMFWGMAAWRSGILRAPERHRGKLFATLALGAAMGAAATVLQAGAAPVLTALAYVSVLLLLKPGSASLPGLTAAGRMALTNYLLQSLVLGFVFYGYGLGLFGRIGSAAAGCIGMAIYAAQIQLSRLWLARFRFGPFEWLWRSLAYGQRQPMLRRK